MSERDDQLRSGDVMFGPIGGVVPGLLPVAAGQALLFLTRRWWRLVRSPGRWFRIRHVGIVDWDQAGAEIIQAMPKGCERARFDPAKHWTRDHVYIRPAYRDDGQNVDVADAAIDYVGTPYGFLTYARLAAGAFRMRLTEGWLRRHLSTRRDMICSQHVDQSLTDACYHVFDDGRLPQDVVPAELFDALISLPGQFLIPGHPTLGQWTDNTEYPR